MKHFRTISKLGVCPEQLIFVCPSLQRGRYKGSLSGWRKGASVGTPSIKYITRGYEAPLIQNRRSHAYPYRLRALLRISADNAYDSNVERALLARLLTGATRLSDNDPDGSY